MISNPSDVPTEDQHNDSANSSNEWGACRLRQRRSLNRSCTTAPGKSSARQTRSSDGALHSTQQPAPEATDHAAKDASSSSESEDVVRHGAVSCSVMNCEPITSSPCRFLQTKRKSESTAESLSDTVATHEKKTCRRTEAPEAGSSGSHLYRNPIPSKEHPPPGFSQWLTTFQVIKLS